MYWAINDSLTLIGRSVRHSVRSIDALLTAAMLPILILLLFVYVFGGAIQTDGDYVDYVVPGIILLCAGFGSATTAVAVCQDMTNGVIDRFRSLPIAASSVLTGHVVASVLRNLVSTALVVGVALLIGFRPDAGVLGWLGAIAILRRLHDGDLVARGRVRADRRATPRRPAPSRSSSCSCRTSAARSCRPRRCRPRSRRSPPTSRSRRSSRPSGHCSRARPPAATRSPRWRGAQARSCSGAGRRRCCSGRGVGDKRRFPPDGASLRRNEPLEHR